MSGMYFEDFEVGARFVTAGRTVTESDVMSFAGLSGDMNPLHVDREFARGTAFGEPVAHGLLVLSIAAGSGGSSAPSSSATRSTWSRP